MLILFPCDLFMFVISILNSPFSIHSQKCGGQKCRKRSEWLNTFLSCQQLINDFCSLNHVQSTLDGTRGSAVQSSITRGGTKSTDKEKKIGHRRVGEDGEITYKKIQTSTIMGSIQLGIQHTVSSDDLRLSIFSLSVNP